ncbi:hypothetical protein ACFL1S_00080 [Pseudomonadota bacterium]
MLIASDIYPEPGQRKNGSGKYNTTAGIGIAIFLVCFLSSAYYYNGASWNQNARLNPVFSYVESGTDDFRSFRMNRFIVLDGNTAPTENTGDWVRFDGDFYSNKAPGTIFLGVIAYQAIYEFEQLFNIEVGDPKLDIANAYLINLFVSALPVALCIAFFFVHMINSHVPPFLSVAISLSMFMGTALYPYSTQLWGHTTAAAFIFFSLYVYLGHSRSRIFWAGLLSGFAVCTDYQAFIFTVVFGVAIVIKKRENSLLYVAGGSIPLALFIFYHYICFDSPIAFATYYQNPEFMDQTKHFGLFGPPSLEIVWKLLFSTEKGIFIHMPVLLMSILGYYYWIKRNPHDDVLWINLATVLIYVLSFSSYYWWHGGATVTARFLIPIIPLLFWALRAIPWSKQSVAVFYGLTCISVANMSVVAAVSPLIEDYTSNPLLVTYTRFLNSELNPFDLFIKLHKFHPDIADFIQNTTWNVGELMGLEGLSSVAPLILFQMVCVGGLLVLARRTSGVSG